jgi:hypothetical protein
VEALSAYVADITAIFSTRRSGARHRGLVNFKYSRIFNGVFEMQNSTKNGKIFAKMRALETGAPRINYVCINYDRYPSKINLPSRIGDYAFRTGRRSIQTGPEFPGRRSVVPSRRMRARVRPEKCEAAFR